MISGTFAEWWPAILIPVLLLVVLILFGIQFYKNWIKGKGKKGRK
jgi:hypothetical protein